MRSGLKLQFRAGYIGTRAFFISWNPQLTILTSTSTDCHCLPMNDSGTLKNPVISLLEGVTQLESEASWAFVSGHKSFWFSCQSFQTHPGSVRRIRVTLSACSEVDEATLPLESKAASSEGTMSFWFLKYCWQMSLKYHWNKDSCFVVTVFPFVFFKRTKIYTKNAFWLT